MWINPQETSDLFTFTKEILNEKLHFLCSEDGSIHKTGLSVNYIRKDLSRTVSNVCLKPIPPKEILEISDIFAKVIWKILNFSNICVFVFVVIMISVNSYAIPFKETPWWIVKSVDVPFVGRLAFNMIILQGDKIHYCCNVLRQ